MHGIITPPLGRGAEYCDERVCLCVCVCFSVRDQIFGTTRPIVAIVVHVTCGRVSLGPLAA